MNKTVLRLQGVIRTYRTGSEELKVLRGVDLELHSGTWCCIYGASGSGKTTLLNLIGALEAPNGGSIEVCGVQLAGLNRRQAAVFRSRKLGFVFQSYHLMPELSILENVAFAGSLDNQSARSANRRAQELLEKVGLKERMDHRPAELSGGEQQRAAIARALMNRPLLLLADEPTGNLDRHTGGEILKLFGELRRENPEQGIVMITHNRDIAALADRVLELRDGKLRE